MGFSIPAYASLFGESLGTIVLSSKEEIEDNVNFFPQMFLVAGIISGIARIVEVGKHYTRIVFGSDIRQATEENCAEPVAPTRRFNLRFANLIWNRLKSFRGT